MPLIAGTRLGPYEIQSLIGTGGMGEVWKARDVRLDRIVAVKKLKGEHLGRFEQEARAIAALNHPHICQIYDIGPDYLVLEYVEGAPLRGPMPLHDALTVAIQVVSALEEAHRCKILHRDLKPTNILLTAKGAKLLDFGLAKLAASPLPETTVTVDGVILGTPSYMSPEQAKGKSLNERSDLFSFGCVLYELLTGRRAFGGGSMYETLRSVVETTPKPFESPAAGIVFRCLAKDPAARFGSAQELLAALSALAGNPGPMPVMTLSGSAFKNADKSVSLTPSPDSWTREDSGVWSDLFVEQRTIAVLPLVNISPDPANDYICDGLAEELINGLTQMNSLRVVSRSSTFQCKGTNLDVREVGRRLHTRLVVHGSVRRAGDMIRLTAQLSDTKEGYQIWSQRFDSTIQDLFALQDELTDAVLDKLREVLGAKMPLPVVKRPAANAEAHQNYLQARYAFNQETPAGLLNALELFQKAAAADAGYPPALVGIAEAKLRMVWYGLEAPEVAVPDAKAALSKAFRLDPESVLGRYLLATIQAGYDWDWNAASRSFAHALAAGKGLAPVHFHYALDYLTPQGHLEEALVSIQRALSLDPISPITRTALGGCYYRMRRWDDAIQILRATLRSHPGFVHAHWSLGRALLEKGEMEEGLWHFEEVLRSSGPTHSALAELGYCYSRVGRPDDAWRTLAELEEMAAKVYVSPMSPALICAGLRDESRAMEYLEKAFQNRTRQLVWLNVDPRFDTLHGNTDFLYLVTRLGLTLPTAERRQQYLTYSPPFQSTDASMQR
jgi:eukaryotic-like serine/threonine-protein kinase